MVIALGDCSHEINAFKTFAKCKIPNVLGALDGTLVAIRKPSKDPLEYWCRKSMYAVSSQIIFGADLMILYVATGFPGSMHDSNQFRSTSFCRQIEQGDICSNPILNLENRLEIRPILLADGAYRLSTYLLKPYNGIRLTPSKIQFNKFLSGARVVAERGNGVLKARWRILLKTMEINIENCAKYITGCCVLHNICQSQNQPYDNDFVEEVIILNAENPNVQHIDLPENGLQLRESMRAYIDHVHPL
jgi:hypothetical protein